MEPVFTRHQQRRVPLPVGRNAGRACGKAYGRLFSQLDLVSARLEKQRYLVRDTITEADVRLFTTLVRFDRLYRRDASALGVRPRPCSGHRGSAKPSTSITSTAVYYEATSDKQAHGDRAGGADLRTCRAGAKRTVARRWVTGLPSTARPAAPGSRTRSCLPSTPCSGQPPGDRCRPRDPLAIPARRGRPPAVWSRRTARADPMSRRGPRAPWDRAAATARRRPPRGAVAGHVHADRHDDDDGDHDERDEHATSSCGGRFPRVATAIRRLLGREAHSPASVPRRAAAMSQSPGSVVLAH